MARANIGGSSNDATGSNLLKTSLSDRLEDAYDRLEELQDLALDAAADGDIEKAKSIRDTVLRQRSEIAKLRAKLTAL